MRPPSSQILLPFLMLAACGGDTTAPPQPPRMLPATSAAEAPGGVAEGLRLWLRSDAGVVSSGTNVIQWNDQSGNGIDAVWNAANIFGEAPPTLVGSNSLIGGGPSIRFNGAEALELDLTWLTGSDYTIIIMNGRDRGGLANFYIAGDAILQNGNLVLGYELPNLLRLAHFNNDLNAVVEDYTGSPLWSLDTHQFAAVSGRDIYHNGSHVATDDNAQALISNTGTTLGHFRAFPVFWFQGDLAEILIYNRVLTPDERLRVEAGVAGKYGMPLSLDDYVPCSGPWENHGAYVSHLARAVDVFVAAGVMTGRAGGAAMAEGAGSSCGA